MCEIESTNIWEEYMPEYVNLYHVNYDENLDGNFPLLQRCVKGNSLAELNEEVFDNWEFPEEMYMDEIRKVMEADGLHDEYDIHYEEIRDWLYGHDQSTPTEDLLRNTRDQVFFYSPGLELDGCHDNRGGAYRNGSGKMAAYKIRRALGLKKGGKNDEAIRDMVSEASYGGELRIYFSASLTDLVDETEDFNTISFNGKCAIAIVHSGNGSGSDCVVELDLQLPFIRDNLFIDRCVKYSYTYDICCMSDDWCEDTHFKLGHAKPKRKSTINKSNMNAHLEQEAKYEETFKSGKCTLGDMDINRHRKIQYINNYPCGNHCTQCGTFWID